MTRKTNQAMTVLIYRRTQMYDPCQCGVFGIYDCMGRIRSWAYDAVIGIGAKDAEDDDISYKLTWVGINASKQKKQQLRGPLVTFDHFCLMNEKGPMLCDCAPLLYQHMFTHKKIPHAALSTSRREDVQKEITNLVNQYRNYPSSQGECQCKQY